MIIYKTKGQNAGTMRYMHTVKDGAAASTNERHAIELEDQPKMQLKYVYSSVAIVRRALNHEH